MAELFKNMKHLCHYIISGKIRLARQDQNFISSINNLFSSQGQITTNQVDLFNHIIRKHGRQLTNLGHDVNKLLALPWNIAIVESTPKYTDAHLSLVDGDIIFQGPYNTKFLKLLRESQRLFVWDKQQKQFAAKYNTIALKLIIDAAFKHYETVHCCPIIIRLMDELVQYDNTKYWAPTLVKHNDYYMIAASNKIIDNIISKINLNSDPYTLNYLAKHAINIDDSIIETADQLFASMYNPIVDYANIDELVVWLHQIKCDLIYTSDHHNAPIWKKLKATLNDSGIPIRELSLWSTPTKERNKENVVMIKKLSDDGWLEHIQPLAKVISMVNNSPINIK